MSLSEDAVRGYQWRDPEQTGRRLSKDTWEAEAAAEVRTLTRATGWTAPAGWQDESWEFTQQLLDRLRREWAEFGPYHMVEGFGEYPVRIASALAEVASDLGHLEQAGYDIATNTYTYRWRA